MENIQQYYRNKTKESCRECEVPFCCALCPVLDTEMGYLPVGEFDWILLPDDKGAPQGMIFNFDAPNVMTVIEVTPTSFDVSLGDKWIVKPHPQNHYIALQQIYKSQNSTVLLTRSVDENIDDYLKLLENEKCPYYDYNEANLGCNYSYYIESTNNRLDLIVNIPSQVSLVSVVEKLKSLASMHPSCEIKVITNRQE